MNDEPSCVTVCGRDQLLSVLILDSKIPPVLAVKAALGAECRQRLSSVPGDFPWELRHNCDKTSHGVLEKRIYLP